MKYLFFDIECSNCFNGVGKMCEFGYVITDENFKVISASDIPMSPGRGKGDRFHLRDRMNVEDVPLAYDEEFYYSQPELPEYYDRIKGLMEGEDTICFAYSASNDIRYLFDSCNKYRLPPLNYTCYDVQRMAADYLDVGGQPGLHNAAHEIVGPNAAVALNEHLSRDDAKLAMMVMEAICTLKQIDSRTLLEQSESAKVNSVEFIKAFQANKARREAADELRRYMLKQSEIDQERLDIGEFGGLRCSISTKSYSTIEDFKALVDMIHCCGGVFVKKFDDADLIIVKDQENMDFLKEKLSAENAEKYILLSEFKKAYEGGGHR